MKEGPDEQASAYRRLPRRLPRSGQTCHCEAFQSTVKLVPCLVLWCKVAKVLKRSTRSSQSSIRKEIRFSAREVLGRFRDPKNALLGRQDVIDSGQRPQAAEAAAAVSQVRDILIST